MMCQGRAIGVVGFDMPLDRRIAIAGLIASLFSIFSFYLLPDQRWIGWMCFFATVALGVGWLVLEIPVFSKGTRMTLVVAVAVGAAVGGIAAAIAWKAVNDPKTAAQAQPSAADLVAELAKRLPTPGRTGRQLSEWQKVMLTSELAHHPGNKILILVSRGEETLAYANDFRDVFLAAKWKPEGPTLAPPELSIMDVRLAADNAGTPRPGVLSVLAALKTAQVKSAQRYVLDEHIARDSMVLWVGSQSPDGWGPETIAPIGVPKEFWTRPDGPPELGDISKPGAPMVTLVPPAPARSQAGPRLLLEQVKVHTPAKVFGDPVKHVVAKLVSFATITVKNDPKVAGRDGVAKNVSAHVVFSNRMGHHLTVEAEWDKEQMEPPPKVLDNFFGGGRSVWFNVGQRRVLIIAFKLVEDEVAYALTVQPNVKELEVPAPGLALPKGEYRVIVEVRSDTSHIREDFPFTLRHDGKGTPLELSRAAPN
jgi:predicted secreted Zn-dependent protease